MKSVSRKMIAGGVEGRLDWEPGSLASSLDFFLKHKVGMTPSTHWT